MRNFEFSFEHYANEVLPRKIEMFEALMDKSIRVKTLFGKGNGERSVIKRLGRMSDFKGIYSFIDNGEVIYVGTSEKVVNRLSYQVKGYTKYQAHLAWELAKENNWLSNNKAKTPDLKRAKKLIMDMDVLMMEITSPVERHLMEIYACMHFDCKFNFFESHR